MDTSTSDRQTVSLPGRPWVVGGRGAVCLVQVQGQPLIPVFRTAEASRTFMSWLGERLPAHVYPQLPDEQAFVAYLGTAMRQGAVGYVLMDPDRWYVIGFAAALTPPPAVAGDQILAGV